MWLKRLTHNKKLLGSSIFVCIIILVAILGPYLVPNDPYKTDLSNALVAPCWQFPFGTDQLGRCILSRVLSGAPFSVFSAIGIVFVITIIGTIIGVVSGYLGGILDTIIMRITIIFQAFPYFLLAVCVAGILGSGLINGMIAVAFVYWTNYARLGRSLVLGIKEENYIKAAKIFGARGPSIVGKYIIPNIASPIFVTAVLDVSAIILTLSGLSFLGLGAQQPTPEWGAMMSEGRSYLQTQPWLVLFPGFAVFFVAIGFNLFSDGVREYLDRKTNV